MVLRTSALNASLIIKTSHMIVLTCDPNSLAYDVALPSMILNILKCRYNIEVDPIVVFHLPALFYLGVLIYLLRLTT